MAVTITYSPRNFRGSTSDTDHPSYPEELRIKDATQTALTAGFGSNAGTLEATETAVTAVATNVTTLSTSGVIRVPISLTANGTWATYAEIPKAATVTAISLTTPTVFASTGGTVLLTVKKTSSGGNTMLNAATYDLELASANARTAMTLTATGADLGIAALGLIYIAIVSNNADATGPAESAAQLTIAYTTTIV